MPDSRQTLTHGFWKFEGLSHSLPKESSIFSSLPPTSNFLKNHEHTHPKNLLSLEALYEAHIGIASPEAKIATSKKFTINVVKHVGEQLSVCIWTWKRGGFTEYHYVKSDRKDTNSLCDK